MPLAGAEFWLVEPDSDQATTQCPTTDLDKTFYPDQRLPHLTVVGNKSGITTYSWKVWW